MTAKPWRKVAVDDELWARFLAFGERYDIRGYRNRITVAATLTALLELAEEYMEGEE